MRNLGILAVFVSALAACGVSPADDNNRTDDTQQELGGATTNTLHWTLIGATEGCIDFFEHTCPGERACPGTPVEGAVCSPSGPCEVWHGGATFAAWVCN